METTALPNCFHRCIIWADEPDATVSTVDGLESQHGASVGVAAPSGLGQSTMPFDRSILTGVAIFRWLALSWATVGVALSWRKLDYTALAAFLLLGAFVISGAATYFAARLPRLLLSWPILAGEFVFGIVMTVADGFVYGNNDVPLRAQSLPWAWPSAAIISAAVAFGPRIGFVAAIMMTGARFIGEGQVHGFDGWNMRMSSNAGLYVITAIAAGMVSQRLRAAEREISTVRAREEMSRTLHDGVLQTLAVIQRRSSDPELAALAHDQERDLRDYLFGSKVTEAFPVAIRAVATRVERQFGLSNQVVLAPDLPQLSTESSDALVGAVGEALTNAAKHSGSQRVVVYAEPTDDGEGVFCSVKDDGAGFDVDADHAGQGVRQSIQARIAEVGGTVEIDSRQGRGTEVRLWVS